MDVMTLATELARVIDEKGLEVKAEDLTQFEGVGNAKAALILAAVEFARRRIKPEGSKIVTPADLLPHVRHYADRKQEHFLCATINGAKRNAEHPHRFDWPRRPQSGRPREVFAELRFLIAPRGHRRPDHPSGSLQPFPTTSPLPPSLRLRGQSSASSCSTA